MTPFHKSYLCVLMCWSSSLLASEEVNKATSKTNSSSVQKIQTQKTPSSSESKVDPLKKQKTPESKSADSVKQKSSSTSTIAEMNKNVKKTEGANDQVGRPENGKETAPPIKAADSNSTDDELASLNKLYDSSIKTLIDQRCQSCHVERKSNMSDFNQVRIFAEKAYKNMKMGMMPPKPIPQEERIQILQFFEKLRKYSSQ